MRRCYKVRIVISVVVSAATIVYVAYRYYHSAGNAEVLAITDRVSTAVAAGNRSALEEEPTLQNKKETVDWLLEKSTVVADGYRVRVQRNGENGCLLFDESLITHIGVIETAKGKVSLGFRRDSNTAKLELVTCAGTTWVDSSNSSAGGEIHTGSRGN